MRQSDGSTLHPRTQASRRLHDKHSTKDACHFF
jgi:hypothetical protein